MEPLREVEPLPYKTRRRTFLFLVTLFVVSLPFLYLYATGYRFDLGDPNAIVGTGGMYVAADRSGAEIYIDDELVRETRVFRTAFYAQNLEPKTHKVHVQKEGHHTWVKELPVTSHRVTEAQAFNMPLDPTLRVISEYTSATGSAVVRTQLLSTTTVNTVLGTTTKATTTFSENPEYRTLIPFFRSSTTTKERTLIRQLEEELAGTTTAEAPTSTRTQGGVSLARTSDGSVYATWVGSFENMPYYYCAPTFPRYSTTTEQSVNETLANEATVQSALEEEEEGAPVLIHPVQEVDTEVPCDRRIKLQPGEDILDFEFFPGSTDLVVVELPSGISVMEIDARAWQNLQPLVKGEHLSLHVENGGIYVYDGTLIYQVLLDN